MKKQILILGILSVMFGFALGMMTFILIGRPKVHHTEEKVDLDNSKLDADYPYPSINSEHKAVKVIHYYNGPYSDKFTIKVFDLEGKRYTTLQAAAPDWEDGWCWRQDVLSIGDTPKGK